MAQLELTRAGILGHRRRVSALDARLPAGRSSLERAAWAGLQDSAPRSAVLSLHARVEGIAPNSWEDPALMQVWGPRLAVYVVAARDWALFTVSRLPDDEGDLQVLEDLATRLAAHLEDRRELVGVAAQAIGADPVKLRLVAPTGRFAIRWDGARQSEVWIVPKPDMAPADARRELARRYLHLFGPTTHAAFATWAGISPGQSRAAFRDLAREELLPVATPIRDAFILASDEASLRAAPEPPAAARLLPDGDTYTLVKGAERELLAPDGVTRDTLWTPSIRPGAVLIRGEIVGRWRRDQHRLTASPWRGLSRAETAAVEDEALALPLPGVIKPVVVTWDTPAQRDPHRTRPHTR